ncbi:hypothetical protein GCM10027063_42650 [Promicromonospora xylanilytica]
MGYVHRTPAWAGPLGAKNRTTYWGVVPLRPGGSSRGLPPHPDEVRPTGTFGDWYDAACGYLWRAEQQDLSLVRILAGGLLILLQLVALVPLVQLVGSMLPGGPVGRPETWSVVVGAILLAVGWLCWAVYRRRWNRAWELRKAWSWAVHDPRVLELPERPLSVGEVRDVDIDPEMTHPYRARLHVRIKDRPFVYRVYYRSHTDRVRRREALRSYPPLSAFILATVGVVVSPTWWAPGPGQYGVLLAAYLLAALPPVISSTVRYARRMLLAQALARADVEERHRWMGWQLLHGVPGTTPLKERVSSAAAGSPRALADGGVVDSNDRSPTVSFGTRPDVRAARAAEESVRTTVLGAVVPFGIFGLIAALIAWRQPNLGLAALGGLAVLGLICLALWLWHGSGRQPEGRTGSGFVVLVEVPSYPRTPRATVPTGDMVLTLDDGHAHLIPADSSVPELDLPVTALISGVGSLLRDGKQWLVLPDGSHVAVTCSDYVGLRDAAADAGIAVLIPGPQPL